MTRRDDLARGILRLALGAAIASLGCGGARERAGADGPPPFVIGAIPDQDPERLQRLYGRLTDHLEERLGVPVEYRPVTDYTAAVLAFRAGDLDLVWFGGLTGVQARLQVPGARAILQRTIDREFSSVFIANAQSRLEPSADVRGLRQLRGRRFTFGSESSTSGRLVPQYFLEQAGVGLGDFRGEVGFSGSHDVTIRLVEAGAYEAGALNGQVWTSRVQAGAVDTTRVRAIWWTPPYPDYHWVIRPGLEERYGAGFVRRVEQAFLELDPEIPRDREILELFGADGFIATHDSSYAEIEAIGRRIGKIR